MAQPAQINPWQAVLWRFGIEVEGPFDYEKFRTLCVRVFEADEVEEQEERVRNIFEIFDANADGILNNEELRRCCKWIDATIEPNNVLLIIDVQNDFIDGTLALRDCGYEQEGLEVVEPINQLLKLGVGTSGIWHKVIYTQDWHPSNHISFFENLKMRELHPKSKITKEIAKPFDTVMFLNPPVNQTLWPRHCVMNTWGVELHKDLLRLPGASWVTKGTNPDKESYSAFESENKTSGLEGILSSNSVCETHLYVCGIAYDVCVKETCLDGLSMGYRVAVIDDCCRGVKPTDITAAKALIIKNGGLITCSDRVLSFVKKFKRSLVMAHHAAKFVS